MRTQLVKIGAFGAVLFGCSLFLGVASESYQQGSGGVKAAFARAKDDSTKRDWKGRRHLLDGRLAKVREQVLREQVGLDPARRAVIEKTLLAFHEKRSGVSARMRKSQSEVRRLLAEDSQDQAAFGKLLLEIDRSSEELHGLRRQEVAEVAKVMTPKEQAKFALALQRVQRQMRAAFHRHHEGSGKGGGRGARSNHATDSK